MKRLKHAALGRLKTGQMNRTEEAYARDLELRDLGREHEYFILIRAAA